MEYFQGFLKPGFWHVEKNEIGLNLNLLDTLDGILLSSFQKGRLVTRY